MPPKPPLSTVPGLEKYVQRLADRMLERARAVAA